MKTRKRKANLKTWMEKASLMLSMMGWRGDEDIKRELLDFYRKGHDPATAVMVITQ